MQSFDVIVIGAGPAGEVVAGRLGDGGLEVALVEDRLVGGECSFWACMPSKALLRPGRAARRGAPRPRRDRGGHRLARRDRDAAPPRRGHPRPRRQRHAAVAGRARRDARARARDGHRRAASAGRGWRRAARRARRSCSRAARRRWCRRSTGSPRRSPGRTSRRRRPSASRSSLVVLGGGVVGVELAQAFRSLGAQVTLVEATDRLIAREEPFASEQVGEALRDAGVTIHLGSKAVRVAREAGQTTVELEDGTIVAGEQLLVAIGRTPRTDAVTAVGFEAGEAGRGRRPRPHEARLALRHRRRQRRRPADAHGQVPGAAGRRRDPRQAGCSRRRRPTARAARA